jgi:VanZ family protein
MPLIFIRILRLMPALLLMLLLWCLSAREVINLPGSFPGRDKVLHFSAYALLAVLSGFVFTRREWSVNRHRIFVFIIIFSAAYGVTDELHQSFVPGRDASVYDWLADLAGSVSGAFISFKAAGKIRSRR